VSFRLVIRVAAIASVAAIAAAPALADAPVLPQTNALPWTDPNHLSPLEQLANQVASKIAQRPVRVYCDGENDWAHLAAEQGFDPNTFATWVSFWYYGDTRTISRNSDIAHISPRVCRDLWRYGMAAVKPTKCPTVTHRTKTVVTTIMVSKKVRAKVKVKGKWKTVIKSIRVPKKVKRQVTQDVPGAPAPCYSGASLAAGTPANYADYVYALMQLGRDSIYMHDFRIGVPIDGPFDIRANCLGIEAIPDIAVQFGATPDDAHSIASYAYNVFYASWRAQPYWSADCRENGRLDTSPGDGTFP
jgi:hypothetical protein